MSFCGYCGAARSEDARFCGDCGGDLDQLGRELETFTAQYAAELLDFEDARHAIVTDDEDVADSISNAADECCPKCGTARTEHERFCAECGQSFGPSPSASNHRGRPEAAAMAGPASQSEPKSEQPKPEPVTKVHPEPHQQPVAAAVTLPSPRPAVRPQAAHEPRRREEEPAAPARWGIVAAALAVLLLVSAGAAYWNGWFGPRPAVLAENIQKEVRAAGYQDVVVAAGDDSAIVLTGSVRNAAEQEAVLALARDRSGGGVVSSQLEFKLPATERLAELNRFIAEQLGEPGAVLQQDRDGYVLRGYTGAPGGGQLILAALRDQRWLGAVSDRTVALPVAPAEAAPPTEAPLATTAEPVEVPEQNGSMPTRMPVPASRQQPSQKVPQSRAAVADSPMVSCLLPSTDEVRLPLTECRNRNGLVQ